MENIDKVVEFAPIIIVVLMYIHQNNIFVKPEHLERTRREMMDDIEKKFVTWTAFNAFKEQVNKIDQNVMDIRNYIINERGE